VLRTKTAESIEWSTESDPVWPLLALCGSEIYEQGHLESAIACVGQVSGRIEEVLPVAEIIRRTVSEFADVISRLANDHLAAWQVAVT
jgi:enoyl-[acyl-carrier protein] reductase II